MALTNLRNTWFVTRPQRDPQFFPQALEALKEATNDFQEKWNSNREIQKKYEEILAQKGLKRENISNDGSGGRTWTAMLRTYSLVYLSENGKLVPTKVGLALLTGNKRYENLRKQLLTLQIPNAYFLSSGFRPKYAEGFSIRPIRFLIKLVCQSSLNYYITKEEITFFALTAKKDSDLDEVVVRIMRFRESNREVKENEKKIIAMLDYRERSDSGARDFEKANGDVAHTFMLQAGYTELVDYSDGKLSIDNTSNSYEQTKKILIEFDERYPFNTRYEISEPRFGESAGLDIDSYKSRWFTDAKVASNQQKIDIQVNDVLARFPILIGQEYDEVLNVISLEFPPKKAKEIALKIVDISTELLNIDEKFISSYLNQKDDIEFERQSVEVLRAFGFKTVFHPKPVVKDERTNIDILIHLDDKNIAIIDAKNYEKKFALSANLANHMATEYIPEYEGYEGKHVKHFGYITASSIGGAANLKKIVYKAKTYDDRLQVSGLLISAKALLGLLDYCLENNIDIKQRKQFVITLLGDNEAYELYSEVSERLELD